MKKIFNILWISLLFITCDKESSEEINKPKLLFKSGFEQAVYIDTVIYPNVEDYRFIKGKDTQTGFSWPIDILGASESGIHFIADDNGQAVFARLVDTIGPHNQRSRVLYQKESYKPQDDTQCPYEILDITDGRKDLYIKYWIKIDSVSCVQPNMWRTFFEWKTKGYASGDGFRLISYIYTDQDGIPYWHWQGDQDPGHPIWEIDNRDITVPLNRWFLTEFFWHWSEGGDGMVLWKINGATVGKHTGATTRNHQPIDFIMLFQLYGNVSPKWQWIDEVEIWTGLPE